MRAAPAVWELEGPIMFGPITSNMLIKDMFFLLIVLYFYSIYIYEKNTANVLIDILYHPHQNEAI